MYQLIVYVHLLSAVVWAGGMFFLALVLIPATRNLPAKERGALVSAVGRRFRTIGWACIALLVATGPLILGLRGMTWQSLAPGAVVGSAFGQVLAAKLVLVAVIIALSAVHDFVLGPAATRLLQDEATATPARVAALRRRAAWLARVNTLLVLAVLALAVLLVRGVPV